MDGTNTSSGASVHCSEVGHYLAEVGHGEVLVLKRALSEPPGEQRFHEGQHCGRDGKCSQKHKIGSEHCIHKVLWQELEQAEEPHEDCTSHDGKLQSVLQEAHNCITFAVLRVASLISQILQMG